MPHADDRPTRTPEEARLYMREYRAKNRERVRAAGRAWAKSAYAKDPRKVLVQNARHRAKLRGQLCTIQWQDLRIPTHCPLLGIPISSGQGCLHPGSPSVDRLDSALGYVPGNVWVISHRANTMKNDAPPDELVRFAHAILEKFNAPT